MNFIVERGKPYEYREDATGAQFFSVTQIRNTIHDPYRGIEAEILDAARRRGRLLHTRFWKLLAHRERILPELPLVLPGLEGYCAAMDDWAEKNHVYPLRLESASANRKLGYAGTLDAQVSYSRRKTVTLMDLKTGDEQPTEKIQVLAYEAMEGYRSQRVLVLYIRANGSYVEKWITAKDRITEWPVFLNALNLLKWRAAHGL